MSTRAKWTEGIPDLYADLELAATYHTTEQVSDLTGFAAKTIADLLSRRPISKGTNPLGPLSRPKARIGTKPLYAKEQIEEALRRREAQSGDRFLGGQNQPLPKVSTQEAKRRDLISTNEIASIACVHEQSVRKWISRSDDFPGPVALRDRDSGHSGVPFVVYPRKPVIQWMVANGQLTPQGKPLPKKAPAKV